MVLSGDLGLTEITFYAICMEGTCVGSSWLGNLVVITRRSLTMLADVDNIAYLTDRCCASCLESSCPVSHPCSIFSRVDFLRIPLENGRPLICFPIDIVLCGLARRKVDRTACPFRKPNQIHVESIPAEGYSRLTANCSLPPFEPRLRTSACGAQPAGCPPVLEADRPRVVLRCSLHQQIDHNRAVGLTVLHGFGISGTERSFKPRAMEAIMDSDASPSLTVYYNAYERRKPPSPCNTSPTTC